MLFAAHANQVTAARVLMAAGASVDASDEQGKTAVQYAAYSGHASVLQMLLEGGASINATDREGATALHVAAFFGDPQLTKLLMEHHADPRVPNEDSDVLDIEVSSV